MKINDRILEHIDGNHGIITTAEIERMGFSRALLSMYERNGLLKRVRHGIYILPDSLHDDLFTLMLCSKEIVFSHETALFLNGMSERTPFVHSVTIPSSTKLSRSLNAQCICHYIKPELHSLGETQRLTTFGNPVRCYNAERTVCDMLRSRRRLEEESVLMALKNYASSPERNLPLLSEYAEALGVMKPLKTYMEVLI